MRRGDAVAAVLDAHMARAGERFKGIRHCSAFDPDPAVNTTPIPIPRGLLLDTAFRKGFAHLGSRGLSFDGWLYHTQIAEFADLADAFPDSLVILDHVGAPIGIGSYAACREQVFADWAREIRALAKRPNVRVKLGGLGMALFGFGHEHLDKPAGSAVLASAWKPYVETCIEAFGPERCMFESNFPADKISYSYGVMWNAFKRLVSAASVSERHALFFGCANETYRLALKP
jgi:L-fuconolactonase